MASKRSRKSKRSTRRTRSTKRRMVPGKMRSFSALAPPRYEKKFLDTDTSAAIKQFESTGSVQADFVVMANGTANGSRVGSQITVTNINAHLDVVTGTNGSNPGIAHTPVRIILGIDKQANGAAPAVLDVLQTASPYSFRNMYTLNRFIILKDKLFDMNPILYVSTPNVGECGRIFKFSWKGQLPVLYSGATASITEIKSNNIFLLVISDRDGYNTDDGVQGTIRIKYTDA